MRLSSLPPQNEMLRSSLLPSRTSTTFWAKVISPGDEGGSRIGILTHSANELLLLQPRHTSFPLRWNAGRTID